MTATTNGAAQWIVSRMKNDLLDWDDPQIQEADKRLQKAIGDHLLALAEFGHQAAVTADTRSIRLLSHYCRLVLNTAVEETARLHCVDIDVD
jgi:hypothetical protein